MLARKDARLPRFVEGVLFDLDGTLVDTHDLILSSFRHATREVLGRVISDGVLMQKVGQPLAVQMWDFTADAAVHDELMRVYRAHNEAIHDEVVRAFPGVAEALSALEGCGLALGVVTSKRHALARRALDLLGLSGRFSVLIGSDDCSAHKPDPAPVLLGCRKLGLAPEACLYVGDSPYDLQAGGKAGCMTAAVAWGMFSLDVLEKERPDAVADSLEALRGIVCAARFR